MIYAYIRISSDKQTVKNQKYEILQFSIDKKIQIRNWIEETESGTKKISERKLGTLLKEMKSEDILIVSELSRLGRNLMEVMSVLHDCMERDIKVYTVKGNHELGNNLNSKVLAFAFSLSAEIERQLISERTKEALARVKAEGKKLGRPKGSFSKNTKLSGKEEEIKDLLEKNVSVSAIARVYGVNRITVKNFVGNRKLTESLKRIIINN